MNNRFERSLGAYGMIVIFIKSKKLEGKRLAMAVATLEECVRQIRITSLEHYDAKFVPKEDAVLRRRLRDQIRQDLMMPIARDARTFFRDEPAIARNARVPHATTSDAEVAVAALAMVKAIQPYASEFVAMGHEKGFLKALDKAGRQLEKWAEHVSKRAEHRVAVNRKLEELFRQARGAVAVIDP